MKLVEQIINELGAEGGNSFTFCSGRLAYFKGVKAVEELSSEKVVLVCGRFIVTVDGENLSVGEYFQGDMIINGNIRAVSTEGVK